MPAMTNRPLAAGRAGAFLALVLPGLAAPARGDEPINKGWPSPREAAESLRDVWGEAALKLPGGPSYEAFRDLLPPLRYANTRFRHYPVVLGAPAAPVKARWISNGGAINARADKKPMWKEVGRPVSFYVGKSAAPFGAEPSRLDGPRYLEGHLPVLRVDYADGPTTYEQEAFAPVRGALADAGAVFVR